MGWKQTALAGAAMMLCAAAWAQYPQQYGQQPGYPDPSQQYQGQPDPNQPDPPSRVVRVSVVQGNVSLQPAGVQDFSAASLNYPMTTGDRVYTDNGSVAELEAGTLAVRMAPYTDLSVTEMTDAVAQFGLGQGSVHLRTFSTDPSGVVELDTPNVAITVLAAGDLRIDVAPQGENTTVTLLSGAAQVQGDNFQQQLQLGETLSLTGTNPVIARDVRRPRPDGLDRFSGDRDNVFQASMTANGDYLNSDTIGAEDLGSYGDWMPESDFGPVWYPRGVPVDWQPYSFGHWAYVAPWGWTWVENEPWGFAPFHYGRWAVVRGRWGWLPGPRVVRPVYSPALVAFVGGGASVTAWFPLGPREPYQPWYRTSALYVNRVNVSNIYNRNQAEVRNIYNQRNTNVYINNTTINRVYVNRNVATVAVPQNAFASGRPVHDNAMRVQPGQWSQAPVMNHPGVAPTRAIMNPQPPRGGTPNQNRPPVESRGPGLFPNGDRPGNAQPNSPVNRPFGNQPPQNQPANNGGDNRFNGNPTNDSRRAPFQGQNPGQMNGQQNGGQPGNNRPNQPAQPTQPSQPTNNGGDNRFNGNPSNDMRRTPFQGTISGPLTNQPNGSAPSNNRPAQPTQPVQPTQSTPGNGRPDGGNPFRQGQQPPAAPQQNTNPQRPNDSLPARDLQPRNYQPPTPVGPERAVQNPQQQNQPRPNDAPQRQFQPVQPQPQPQRQPAPQPQVQPQPRAPQPSSQPQQQHQPVQRIEKPQPPPPPKTNN